MKRIGVVGATGYVGAEVVRWVMAHPELSVDVVVARSSVGERYDTVMPGLLGLCDLHISAFDGQELAELDAVFLALPHGVSASMMDALKGVPVVVDCARDHRHVPGWVYGQPEWSAEALRTADRIAAPGCFATAIALGIAPFVAAGMVDGPVMIAAATGSTGSGATPSPGTHHPLRANNLRAYKVLKHQHVPEIRAFLAGLGTAPELHFVPLSAPVDRGILATQFFKCKPGFDADAVLADAYAHHPAIRIREGSPELRWVRGTGLCDLSVYRDEDTIVVLSAIANLGKGAAAQAVQAPRVRLGLDAGHPVLPHLP
ncbi:MAG: N-acetyl-gamma-glutamyl-phosphate reductase [Myxococcota bacterium]